MSARTTKRTKGKDGTNHQDTKDTRKGVRGIATGSRRSVRSPAVSILVCFLGVLGVLVVSLAVTRRWRAAPVSVRPSLSRVGDTASGGAEEQRLLEAAARRPQEPGARLELAQFYLGRRRPA